jgi:tripartite-type tricarboxylate transporter receptor subunit TctC
MCAAGALAQSYPVKPIRLILPFAGGTELIGRMIAGKLSPVLGQQIVADPRFGAAGNIGWEAAAKAPADGYTLVMGAVPVLTNPHLNPKVAYDPLKSFAPIALLATIPNIIVVHPSVPVKSMNAGRMRGLAVLDTRRNASAPHVPTSAEAGIPELLAVNWYALLAPAGVPRALIERLNAEAVKAMSTGDTRASLAAMGGEPASSTPAETAEFLRAEHARWGKVIREANIKAE